VTSSEAQSLAGRSIAVLNWRDLWHPQAGGAEQYAWEMALGMRQHRCRVVYLTARAPGQARREVVDGVDIVRMGGRFTVYPRVLAWLAMRRRRFDAVIDCENGIPFFAPWALPRRVPVVYVVHHVHDAQFGVHFPPLVAAVGRFLEGPVARWTYRRHDCVTISDSTVRALRSRLGWTGPVQVIPCGVSGTVSSDPDPGPTAAALCESDPRSLIWVGRLVAHKRVERVLDIAEHLGPSGVTIEVVGKGPCAEPLARHIEAHALGHVVRVRGYLPEPEKVAAVASATLHLNTSHGEGWGLCVVEAAALGVPTVAYDVDGLRDSVRDGQTGWLVRDGDRIEDVTARALKELEDPVRRAEISAACREWARSFDWSKSSSMMADLILTGIARRGRGTPKRATDG
jgi:glycosyltransferase involved in cell wall biosynthesis